MSEIWEMLSELANIEKQVMAGRHFRFKEKGIRKKIDEVLELMKGNMMKGRYYVITKTDEWAKVKGIYIEGRRRNKLEDISRINVSELMKDDKKLLKEKPRGVVNKFIFDALLFVGYNDKGEAMIFIEDPKNVKLNEALARMIMIDVLKQIKKDLKNGKLEVYNEEWLKW